MQNFNLGNFYDKSLVDVHKYYVDSIMGVDDISLARPKKKPFFVFLSFVLMFASAFGTAYYLHMNRVVIPVERFFSISERKSNEENRGYVRVQVFEFDNESAVTNIALKGEVKERKIGFDNVVDFTPEREDVYRVKIKDIYAMDDTAKGVLPKYKDNATLEPTDKNEKYPISSYKKSGDEMIKNILKDELSPKATKPVQVASTSFIPNVNDMPSRYSIQFDNVNKNQYNTLRNLSSIYRLVIGVNEVSDLSPRWSIYQEDANSSKIINGYKVRLIQSFDSNNDATESIQYLQSDGNNYIIHVEDVVNERYNIKLCCTDIERAKSLAVESQIADRVIRIVRER